ncbi:MAG: FlgD immunoglobulin-like domain containing protein, partial [Bacteroidota bacterium]
QANYSQTPIVQLGRYTGEFPMDIKATGFYKNIGYSKNLTIQNDQAGTSGIYDNKAWISQYLKSLETGTLTSDVVKELVLTSMNNRILSTQTAFLALEPWMMPDDNTNPDGNKDDWTSQVVDENIVASKFIEIKASPNPFADKLTIRLNFKDIQGFAIQKIEVFNMMGVFVKSVSANTISSNAEIIWDGTDKQGNRLPNGTYMLVLTTNIGRISYKVIIYR